jgi:hypothetical protein
MFAKQTSPWPETGCNKKEEEKKKCYPVTMNYKATVNVGNCSV